MSHKHLLMKSQLFKKKKRNHPREEYWSLTCTSPCKHAKTPRIPPSTLPTSPRVCPPCSSFLLRLCSWMGKPSSPPSWCHGTSHQTPRNRNRGTPLWGIHLVTATWAEEGWSSWCSSNSVDFDSFLLLPTPWREVTSRHAVGWFQLGVLIPSP